MESETALAVQALALKGETMTINWQAVSTLNWPSEAIPSILEGLPTCQPCR